MHYVYLIRSAIHPKEKYYGYTQDLRKRLNKHNLGEAKYTARDKPWKLEAYVAFQTKESALKFEKYIKSGSGRAFANKHLWNDSLKTSTNGRSHKP